MLQRTASLAMRPARKNAIFAETKNFRNFSSASQCGHPGLSRHTRRSNKFRETRLTHDTEHRCTSLRTAPRLSHAPVTARAHPSLSPLRTRALELLTSTCQKHNIFQLQWVLTGVPRRRDLVAVGRPRAPLVARHRFPDTHTLASWN